MRGWEGLRLTEVQVERVFGWLESPTVIDDLSWGLATIVLHIRASERDYIVKAGGPTSHHIGREITAHDSWTATLADRHRAPRLVGSDREANVLVLEYLKGRLVEGSESEFDAHAYQQAGSLLRLLHTQAERLDQEYEARATVKALTYLDSTHRIEATAEREARAVLRSYRPVPGRSVPTHGDWQPRNWLIDADVVKVIDFGRFDFRPAATDLCRLAVQQWQVEPALEAAFLSGYGIDPREPELWRIELLREAVNTAVWAHQVGDPEFEAQGHQMLQDALALF